MKRLLKHPAFHIIALGVLFYILHSIIFGADDAADNVIRITEGQVEEMVAKWQMTFRREPTRKELTSIVGQHIREEVFYREAMKLGLDKDDIVIRRRLAQKMDFLSRDLASLARPTEQEIADFYEKNLENYRIPPAIDFSHVFFNVDKHGVLEAQDLALDVRRELTARARPMEEAYEMGDLFVLQHYYPARTPADVEGLFGRQEIVDTLFTIEPGAWHGPAVSGYGLHLVYVHEKIESWTPELDEIMEQVEADLMDDIRRQTNEIFFAGLRSNYEIEIDEAISTSIDLDTWKPPGAGATEGD